MADSTRTVVLTAPNAGEHVALRVEPTALLQVEFDINATQVTRVDNDLVFSFENGSKITLIDFIDLIANGQAPEFAFSDGAVVAGDVLIASLGDIPIETAAGAAAVGGGGSTYVYDPGSLYDGFDSLNLQSGAGARASGSAVEGGAGGAGGADGASVLVNHAPEVAGALSFNMDEDGTITITAAQLLANASDIDGDVLSVVNLSADNGTLTPNGAGSWTFTPDKDFNGTLNLTFDVSDGDLTTPSGATVVVAPVNDAPVAQAATDSATEDGAVITGQLHATDVDTGDELTFSVVGEAPDGFSLNADGSYSFDPSHLTYNGLAEGEKHDVVVQYQVSDGNGGTATETLTITVTGTNDAPTLSFVSSDGSNLITNGNFENVGEAISGWQAVNESNLEGWDSHSSNVIWIWKNEGVQGVPSANGDYHAELYAGDVSQQVALTDKGSYMLQFDARSFTNSAGNTSEAIEVLWKGEVVAVIRPTQDWQTYSVKVDGQWEGDGNGVCDLTFRQSDSSPDGYGPLLDNVALFQVPTVNENSAAGTYVTTALGQDVDGDALTYSIVGGDENSWFTINPTTGEITVAQGAEIDAEKLTAVTLTVAVNDGHETVTRTLTVNIADLNDNKPVFTDVSVASGINEFSEAGTEVASFTLTDADVTAAHNDAHFSLTGATLKTEYGNADISLSATEVADYFEMEFSEGKGSIALTASGQKYFDTLELGDVTVTLHGVGTDGTHNTTQNFTFDVKNVNEAPTLSFGSLDETNLIINGSFENLGGVQVGTWSPVSENKVDGWYSNVGNKIEIWNSGFLGVDSSDGDHHAELDYAGLIDDISQKIAGLDGGSYVLQFDARSRSFTSEGVEKATEAIEVLWNGEVKAVIYATNGWQTYSVVVEGAGEGELSFRELATGNDSLGPLLDNVSMHKVEPVIDGSITIDENSAAGTVVTMALGQDIDGDALTYWFKSGDKLVSSIDGFAINKTTGEITVADGSMLDAEKLSKVDLSVAVTDGLETVTKTLTVNIADINDNAPEFSKVNTSGITEFSEAGTEVASFALQDHDVTAAHNTVGFNLAGATLSTAFDGGTITLDATDVNKYFKVVFAEGVGSIKLTSDGQDYFDTLELGDVTVTLHGIGSDGSPQTTAQDFSFVVEDVNEAPSLSLVDSVSISESSEVGDLVATAAGSDVDAGSTLSYWFLDGNNARTDSLNGFAIDTATGEISLVDPSQINYESTPKHAVTLQVVSYDGTDSIEGLQSEPKTLTVNITDANEAPIVSFKNSIINGSFEDGVDFGSSNWTKAESLPGWQNEANTWMEPHKGSHMGVGTTHGENYMDLGGSPGNAHISQVINGLDSGETYTLQFSLFDKAFVANAGESSGRLEVIWNGDVVATLEGDQRSWSEISLDLVATGDADKLEFREIGTSVRDDNHGIALDNIRLFSISSSAERTVAENAANGTLVATALGADVDAGTTLSYWFIDDGKRVSTLDGFAIDTATGEITVVDSNQIDYESATDHAIKLDVVSYDGTLESAPKTLTVNISDVPEMITVDEGHSVTLTVADLSVSSESLIGNVLRLDGLPAGGEVLLNGVALKSGQTFTYEQLKQGLVSYAHAGGEDTSDVVRFDILDETGKKLLVDRASVNVTVNPINDIPVLDLDSTGSVEVVYQSQSAGYNNVLGVYTYNEAGEPVFQQVLLDHTRNADGKVDESLLNTVIGNFDARENLHFFILPNGGGSWATKDASDQIRFEKEGNAWKLCVGEDGDKLTLSAYFSDQQLNADGLNHFRVVHNADGSVILNIEDLWNGGDRDYHDIDAAIRLTNPVDDDFGFTNTFVDGGEGVAIVGDVRISDADNTHMKQAVVTLKGAVVGDMLYIDGASSSDVEGVLPSGITWSLTEGGTVITLSGNALSDQYEEALQQIRYKNTTNLASGNTTREIDVTVTDADNGSSNTATATIAVVGENDVVFTTSHQGVQDPDYTNSFATRFAQNETRQVNGHEVVVENGSSITVDEWNGVKSVLAESRGDADVTINNFVRADVRLGVGATDDGSVGSHVTINDAKRGTVTTGNDNDHIVVNAKTNEAPGAGWSDTFVIKTNDGNDVLDLKGAGGSTVFDVEAGAGSDTVKISGAVYGLNLDGGAGDGVDTLDFSDYSKGVTVNLAAETGVSGSRPGGDSIRGFENLTGSAHDDILAGDAKGNVIDGGVGNDTIWGGDGDDTLLGGVGNDDLLSGTGNNLLDGGDGNDRLYSYDGVNVLNGGEGTDEASYIYASAGVTVDLANGVTQKSEGTEDTLNSIEKVQGSNYNDRLIGDGDNNQLQGEAGNDTLIGGAGNDSLYGGDGNDILRGGSGADELIGGAGDDTIHGGAGNDTVHGGADNDIIYGDSGNDQIDGGDSLDTVVFSGNRSDYHIHWNEATQSYTVTDTREGSMDGEDVVTNVEYFQFNDGTVAAENLIGLQLTMKLDSLNPTAPGIPTGAVVHLDAQVTDSLDRGTFYNPNANNVNVWKDLQSGPGETAEHAHASGCDIPVFVADAFGEGLGGVRFDGWWDKMNLTGNALAAGTSTGSRSIAMVFKTSNEIGWTQMLYEQGGDKDFAKKNAPVPDQDGLNLFIADGHLYASVFDKDGSNSWNDSFAQQVIDLGAVSENTAYSVVISYNASTGILSGWNNGVESTARTGGAIFLEKHDGVSIGDVTGGSYDQDGYPLSGTLAEASFKGTLGEVVIWNNALSGEQAGQANDYMRSHWFGETGTEIAAGTAMGDFSGFAQGCEHTPTLTMDSTVGDNQYFSIVDNHLVRSDVSGLETLDTAHITVVLHDGTSETTHSFVIGLADQEGSPIAQGAVYHEVVANDHGILNGLDGVADIFTIGELTQNLLVSDFSTTDHDVLDLSGLSVAHGNDTLKLHDLLSESSDAGETLGKYLTVEDTGSDLQISVFAGGDATTGGHATHTITLADAGVGNVDSASILNELLANGKLVTDL